jgi:hypothetical protein
VKRKHFQSAGLPSGILVSFSPAMKAKSDHNPASSIR